MTFSPEVFKRHFPLFSQPENKRLVYLDNAATTQKPQAVIDAFGDFYLHSNANAHRASHRLARRATETVERVRAEAATFINAASAAEIIFCRGATEALNLIANSLCSELRAGDEIVVSTLEHHANIVPWQMMAQRYGLHLRYIPHTAGVPHFNRLDEVLNERTRIVSLSGGSNALGLRPDLAHIARQLQGRNLRWIVDGAQLAAHENVDVREIGCDFFVCSAHKFYGPSGIGLLYGRESLLKTMPPWQGGGEMIAEVDLFDSRYAEPPHRFEPGTSPLASIAALGAALAFLDQQDRAAMAAHEQKLTAWLHGQLEKLSGVHLLSEARNNLGITAFIPEHGNAADLMHWLDERDIAVRVGHHCAQPLIRAVGGSATVRVSVAGYTTQSDLEQLVQAVADYLADLSAPVTARRKVSAWSGDDLSALKLEQLSARRNWQDRYRELMRWSRAIAEKPQIRQPEHLVQGCESHAWLVCREEEGRYFFALDSDSRVVKGLGALLLSQVDGRTADEIRTLDIKSLFTELGMEKHLSESRSNGFYALVRRVLALIG
ncbi:aminotransferase class V-fold PLP-dependent enzyme [Microbulbifer thermotolerans]|uniref:cysteine desulfurase n=1 Tax=Microbulbifer thermotolerans TaxID=252514 RepID=A0A143HMK9_MICTH|nr:aminotransferase class V-fold PLP-dependent enzyme [Microbulbifer thermotolerans]AMX02757.1 cysteine desulfurase [Microbulbifer thermotolerans]